jgi:uncharacterized membrane protein (UPF0127 family)
MNPQESLRTAATKAYAVGSLLFNQKALRSFVAKSGQLFASLLIFSAVFGPAYSQESPTEFPVIQLSAGIHLIQAELASNFRQREKGLMFRETMGVNQGMAFVFEQPAVQCMWMRNTLLPLSVAFMSTDGTILNIEDMKPQTDDSHCAIKPATYALEMNLGWFAKRGIKPGSKISGLPKVQ